MHDLLASGKYKTSQYKNRTIYEPKKRELFILPFYPDRIVHHAIMNILEPIWNSLFDERSYSCRKGYGQHKASLWCMKLTMKFRYCLKCDVSKFYPSIRHDILKKIIRQKIKCKRTLELLDEIIDSVPGETNCPIGNLLSQWLGNLYMNETDKFIRQELKCHDYVRYCDDFILFSNDKEYLWYCKNQIEDFIHDNLALKFSKAFVFPTSRGIDFLGYRHFPNGYILIRKSTVKREKRMIKAIPHEIREGKLNYEKALSKIGGIHGVIKHANAYHYRQSLNIETLKQEILNGGIKMKGYPKTLNTKEDYMYVKENFPSEQWIPDFQTLLDTMKDWFYIATLEKQEDGVTDKTHKIVEQQQEDGSMMYYQYALQINPQCKLFSIGFTEQEIKDIIKNK